MTFPLSQAVCCREDIENFVHAFTKSVTKPLRQDDWYQMFADAGYKVEPAVAWYAWSEVSMSVHAHWLMLDSSANHVEHMLRFLIEKEQ